MPATHESIEDPRNENVLIYINGKLVPRKDAMVSVFDSGFLLGDGFWESFRIHNGQIAFFDRHMARLLGNAKALAIDLPFGHVEIKRALTQTIQANQLDDTGYLRLIITRGIKKTPWQDPRLNVGGPTIVIIGEFKAPNPRVAEDGIRLFTVHVRRGHPDVLDPKLHTLSKLNCILACIQAIQAGSDEALMLDPHGFVATCNSTNFFIVQRGEVWTSTGDYCLHGTTRGVVMDICRKAGIPTFEKSFSLMEVYGAEEAFATGTFGGIIPVVAVDGRAIGSGCRGQTTERIQGLYKTCMDLECRPEETVDRM